MSIGKGLFYKQALLSVLLGFTCILWKTSIVLELCYAGPWGHLLEGELTQVIILQWVLQLLKT